MSGDELTFREAKRDDVPTIVSLLANDPLGMAREKAGDQLPEPYWKAFDAIEHDPNNVLIVAELDGRIVGTLQLTYIPGLTYTGGERAQIEGVRVSAELRGHGVGQALVGHVIELARERGCHVVQLTTDRQRPDAIRFYQKIGFRPSHMGMKYHLRARCRGPRRGPAGGSGQRLATNQRPAAPERLLVVALMSVVRGHVRSVALMSVVRGHRL